MNELQIFKYQNAEIRTVLIDEEPWWVAKDVCDVLDLGDVSKATSRLEEDEKGTTSIPTLGGQQTMLIINEPGLYSLILGSRKAEAKAFKRWITHEVIPTIRKHGAYMTQAKIEEVLSDPDTIIKLALELKAHKERTKLLEAEVVHKEEIITGFVSDLDILTKRNIINRVVRHEGANFQERWAQLYRVFRETYHIDLKDRCKRHNERCTKKKDQLSSIAYAEKFDHINKLYAVAVKLFETDINEILETLKPTA